MLEIKSLTKMYNPESGIQDISISISDGEVVAFVGPNGAGKSTLFNILGRVLQADTGTCSLYGIPFALLHISKIGFLPERMYLLEEFTPPQMIHFVNTMREMNSTNSEVDELICHFGIEPYVQKSIKALSVGMRRRVELACAFLGNPDLIVLDEPLNSLDIQGVLALKDALKDCKKKGQIVLLSSHILDFLDTTADQVVFLGNGKILDICSNTTERAEDLYRRLFT